MHEQTGQMKIIVNKFFEDTKLSEIELNTLKWYIIQWIEGNQATVNLSGYEMPVPPNYKQTIQKLTQEELTKYVHEVLLEYNIDPF